MAKTEISIFRPLRGGSFDARICPLPPYVLSAPSAFQNTDDARELHRARSRSLDVAVNRCPLLLVALLVIRIYRRVKLRDSSWTGVTSGSSSPLPRFT